MSLGFTPFYIKLNEIRKNAGLPLMEMTYHDAVDFFGEMGIDVNSPDFIKDVRRLGMKHHPDRGGDNNTQQMINDAKTAILKAKPPTFAPRARRSYYNPNGNSPEWQTDLRSSNNSVGRSYSDMNYFKYHIWELSKAAGCTKKDRWTIYQYDGKFFRSIITVFGCQQVFDDMIEGMNIWGSSGNRYNTRAIFVWNEKDQKNKVIQLIYVDGKSLSHMPIRVQHDSINANPGNDQQFMRDLPAFLDKVSAK